MNFDFFLTGEYYDMQRELNGRVAALPLMLKQDEAVVQIAKVAALGKPLEMLYGAAWVEEQRRFEERFDHMMSPVHALNKAAISVAVSIGGMTAALEKFGLELDELSSPEQQRQYDVSDWLFTLLYTDRLEDTRLWWLGYWPARAWEHVVLMLPVSWFRERRP